MKKVSELEGDELSLLKHMLGADSRYKKNQWGFRNRYCSVKTGADYERLLKLESMGLVRKAASSALPQDTVYFFATELGCKAIGFNKKQINNAMS